MAETHTGDATADHVDLLARAREGDRAALERLLALQEPTIYRFAMGMCRQPEDAAGVLQETLLVMARSIGDFRGASSLSTWLFTVARSFCIKKRRRSKFAPPVLDSSDDPENPLLTHLSDEGSSPEDVAAAREELRAVSRALATMEPMYREVLLLRDVEGLRAAEVAEIAGISVAAVKSRLHRARSELRGRFMASPPSPSCPSIELLVSRHLEGELSPDVCATMEAHLDGCSSCKDRCDRLRETLSLCRRSSGPKVPAAVQEAVRAEVRALLAGTP
jgi:RNA polymerase sigma-70 factor (ECF subfamily)